MKTIQIYIDELNIEMSLLIGQNKYENDHLIKTCKQNDIWFHLENISGPHFVLQVNDNDNINMKEIPKKYFNHIASLFRQYKSGLSSRYNVIYTEIKNIKLTDEIGTVIPKKINRIKI